MSSGRLGRVFASPTNIGLAGSGGTRPQASLDPPYEVLQYLLVKRVVLYPRSRRTRAGYPRSTRTRLQELRTPLLLVFALTRIFQLENYPLACPTGQIT